MPEINIEPRIDMVRCVHLNIISNERTDIVQYSFGIAGGVGGGGGGGEG